MIRVIAVAGKKGSRVRNCRVYCCADALPTRVFTQPGPKADIPPFSQTWSLTTLRDKLVKIGAKAVRHGRYVTFQLAEVAVSRDLFRKILSLIDDARHQVTP